MFNAFKKIVRNVSGAINDAVDETGNAGREARQIVREYEDKIADAESSLIDVKATYQMLITKRDEQLAEVRRWTDAAKTSVSKGNDTLASECLQEKRKAQSKADEFQRQINIIEPQVKALESRINELKDGLQKLSSEAELLQTKSDISKATLKASEVLGDIDGDSFSGDMQSIRNRVEKQEAKAKVVTEQSNKISNKDLEKRVRELNQDSSLEDELEELKKSMK